MMLDDQVISTSFFVLIGGICYCNRIITSERKQNCEVRLHSELGHAIGRLGGSKTTMLLQEK